MNSAEKWTALGTICVLLLVMAAGARAWQKDIAMIDKLTQVNTQCMDTVDELTPMDSPMPNTILKPAPDCLKYRQNGTCRKWGKP